MRTRGLARSALAIVAFTFAALLLVQIFLAGLGVFDGPGNFVTHRDFGYMISLLILVEIVLAVIGRAGRVIYALLAITAVQMILQSAFVAMRSDQPAIAALHTVNGVLMLILTLVIGWRAWQIRAIGNAANDVAAAPSPSVSSDPVV